MTFARVEVWKHIWFSIPDLQPLEAIVRRAEELAYGCEFIIRFMQRLRGISRSYCVDCI